MFRDIDLQIQAKFDRLEGRINKQDSKIQNLENQIASYEQAKKFKKEVYDVSDLAELLVLAPNTIRRDYLNTGRIKGSKNNLGRWFIAGQEFSRVREVIETKGKWGLEA